MLPAIRQARRRKDKIMDIQMLAILAGKERTRRDFEDLFEASGFRLEREIPTHVGLSILELSPA